MSTRLWEKGEDLDRAIHEFTVGNDPELDLRLVYWDALASAAHARMLHGIEVLSENDLSDLLGALKGVARSGKSGEFSISLEEEDCHTAIENHLIELLGDAGARIHTGRSRNDQVLVAMRLYLRNAATELLESLAELAEVLLVQANSFGHVVFPGHTHFQAAMPCSVKMWLAAFAEDVLKLIRSGLSNDELMNENPLGAASGFGVPLPLNRSETAELLGFAAVQRNPVHVQNSRGREELRFCSFCSDIASSLEKFSWDLIVYSSEEFGYFTLPVEFTTGSSIMPQKRNPDVLELMRGRAGRVRGARTELESVIAKLPSHYHRDYQYTKEPVFRAADNIAEMLPIMSRIISDLSVNKERIEEALTPELFVTYQVYRRVRDGVPFRKAYQEGAGELKAGNIHVADLKSEFDHIAKEIDAEGSQAAEELSLLREKITKKRSTILALEERVFAV